MGKSLLLLVSGLTIVTGIIQVRNNERMDVVSLRSANYYEEQQARNLAKSMVDNAVETMKTNNNWTGSIDLENVVDVGSMGGIVEDVQGNTTGNIDIRGDLTSYTMSSSNIPSDNSVGTWDQYKVLLISTSSYEGIEVTTEVLMQRDSYSKYSYMTESELSSSGGNIWFMGSDNIYGPIHTNGVFKMSGSPSFYGLTTSPNMWQGHSTNPTSPNFYGGENFNAPTKDSPNSYELSKLTAAAATGGITFDGDIDIDFYESSGAGYADINKQIVTTYTCGSRRRPRICTSTSWVQETLDLSTIDGVISSAGKISVEGVVKGNITLHSEDEIEIVGDITYHTSPLADSSSTDLLGLVSEGNVVVDQNAHTASGSADLTVHATIMALNTSFTVENYSSGGVKGTLNLLGGIVQKNRGPVGTFSGSSMVSGYAKNYQYDTRLRGTIPPSFPRESIFSIVYWKDKVVNTN